MNALSVLAQLKIAGALVLTTDLAEFPSNPALGTMVIKGSQLYAFITIDGMQTWYPLVRANSTYVHTQAVAALNWTVSHGLTSGDIWYQVQDNAGNIMFAGSYTVTDNNEFVLGFSEAVAGKVLVVATSAMDVPLVRASQIEVGDVTITPTGVQVGEATLISSADIVAGAGIGVAVGGDGKVTISAEGTSLVDHGTVVDGSEDLAFAAGAHSALHRVQVGAALTLSTSGWPAAGKMGEMMLELVNGAAFAVTWPTIRWIKADGTYTTTFAQNEVTLQSAGTDWVLLFSRDGGATIYGKVMR